MSRVRERDADRQTDRQRHVHLQFVIETQLDVRHATQEDLHHNFAVHIAPQDCALVAHQHVHLHVQELRTQAC